MRVVVVGLGAVGGTVAAALALAGHEVVGVARGAHLQAIRDRGLRFRSPGADRYVRFPTAAAISEVSFRRDDAIFIATKTQHVTGVLEDLAAAGVADQPIFCAQNGVESERLALRRFENVHGVCVLLPAAYTTTGEVAAYGAPCYGIFDIGRYPAGSDADDRAIADVLTRAGLKTFVLDDVMASKYGKLLLNLGNVVEAALGPGQDRADIVTALQDEAKAVLGAAGIGWIDLGLDTPRRRKHMVVSEVEELPHQGGSSAQSLQRGTGNIETDYLNGEIALLARLHGMQAPANAWMARLARRMVAEGLEPGRIERSAIERALGLAG